MITLLDHRDDIIRLVNKINANFGEVRDLIAKIKKSVGELSDSIGSLATVARSGSYNDLSNTPSIPSLSWTLLKHENTSGSSVMANSIVDFSGRTEILAISGMATGNGLALIPTVACGDTDWAQFKTSTDKLIKIRLHPADPTYPTLAVDGGADWYIYGR